VLFFKESGTVEKVLFDFDVKEPRSDVDDSEDEDGPLKEIQGEETHEDQPKGRKRTKRRFLQ
jgi:ribosomal RNA-processing protein 7